MTPMRSALMSWSASQPNAVSVSAMTCSPSSRSTCSCTRSSSDAVELVGAVAVVEVRGDGQPPVTGEAVHETAHRIGDAARLVQHDDPAADRA